MHPRRPVRQKQTTAASGGHMRHEQIQPQKHLTSLKCPPHPLYPRGEEVLDHDGAAVLKAGQGLPAAGHGHGAVRLRACVLPVVRVADRTGRLPPEHQGDALGAERVAAL